MFELIESRFKPVKKDEFNMLDLFERFRKPGVVLRKNGLRHREQTDLVFTLPFSTENNRESGHEKKRKDEIPSKS